MMQTNHNGNLTPQQRLQKNILAVITHPNYRALGGVVMLGETQVVDDCPTAATDGLNVIYGTQFISSLSDPELRFVILHEAMHKSLRHLTTWRHLWKKNPQRANAACDYVINLMLVDSCTDGFIAMPKVGLLDRKYTGMDAGEVFRLMEEEGDGGNGHGFDEHEWDKAAERSKEKEEALEGEIAEALRQGGMLNGKLGGNLARAIGEVLAPKVNWSAELWEFVTSLCKGHDMSTWRRPHRRSIDSGIYTPSTYSESVGRLVVGVDTSGSISGEFINRFLGEVTGICKAVNPEVLDLLYWDSHVAAHEKYGEGQYDMLASSTKPKGGGGTSPSCVSRYLQENAIKPECVVMLTDGYVGNDWGAQWPCPVLWCVVNNKRASASTGRTLHVEI